ncbi:hypothetical protein SLS62_004363 [Diatrype stigma]|uniref:Mitochondrial chaperone BCS1 n=1 Tax=Diatrype stigma TaxID=117547 RepID=A0AAN9YTI3_9PEZI
MPEIATDLLGSLAIRAFGHLFNRWHQQRGYGTAVGLILSLWAFVFSNWARIPGLGSSPTRLVTRLLTSSIVVQDDRLKGDVLNWVAVNVLVRQQTRVLNACSAKSDHQPEPGKASNGMENIRYLPALRNTLFFYKRRPFCLQYNRSRSPPVMDYDGVPVHTDHETLKIVCFGRSAAPIKGFLAACRAFTRDQKESFVVVRFSSGGHCMWDQKALMPIRPLDTIHLDRNTKSELLDDVTNYLDPRTRRFYVSQAIPYRRGYLFYGPPGTGKTSLAIAIAGFVGLPLYRLPSIDSDRSLSALFSQLDPWCIVLLEDIDVVGMRRDRAGVAAENQGGGKSGGSCTLSGLLNVLDGVTSQEGRIVIMTANEPESLDEALIRRGRIDKEIYLGHISADCARQMFMRMTAPEFTGNSVAAAAAAAATTPTKRHGGDHGIGEGSCITMTERDANCHMSTPPHATTTAAAATGDEIETREKLSREFASRVPENTITPAQLQEYLLYYRGNPEGAAANIAAWVDKEALTTVLQRRKEVVHGKIGGAAVAKAGGPWDLGTSA